MPSSPESATTGNPANSGEFFIESPLAASKQSMPSSPVEVTIDIPPSPSKESIPPTCISAIPDSGWIFVNIPLSPTKESSVPPAVHSSKLGLLLRLFLETTFLVFLLLLVIGFLSWFIFTTQVYTKHDPKFQIDSASVDTTVVHNPFDHYVRADWRIEISAGNPNKHTPMVYRKVAVKMFHHLDEFGVSEAIAPFRQEPGNQTTLIVRSEPESKGTKLRYEILETILEFNVTMQVELSYKCRTCLREGLFELEVFCPEVEVFHASNGPKIGGPQQCSVQSKRQIN